MKKVILAVVLLVVVVGVGYLSALKNQAAEKSRYQEGYAKGTQEASVAKKEADSLRAVLEKHEVAFSDSVKELNARHGRELDSMSHVVASKDSLIRAATKVRKAPAQVARPVKSPAKVAVNKTDALTHLQVLDYYKRRLGQLPTDLSDYERKVAVDEIREETAKKFSITTADLDKIRQNSNVSE
jgi:hypothetical protein